MRLTTKGRYGVRAIINLASAYANRPISIKKIATEEDISPEFLEQIFFKLKKAGLINSVRGPGGGFLLNKKIGEISVKDILDAVGESTFPTPCSDPAERDNCPRMSECMVTATWLGFSKVINDHLAKLTVKDIVEQNSSKFYEELKTGQDFAI